MLRCCWSKIQKLWVFSWNSTQSNSEDQITFAYKLLNPMQESLCDDVNSPWKHCCAILNIYILLTETCSWTIYSNAFLLFPLQQWLMRELLIVVLYVGCLYIVLVEFATSFSLTFSYLLKLITFIAKFIPFYKFLLIGFDLKYTLLYYVLLLSMLLTFCNLMVTVRTTTLIFINCLCCRHYL